MCSSILNIVFMVILICGLIGALVATFTPQWRKVSYSDGVSAATSGDYGFFTGGACLTSSCIKSSFNDKESWEKAAFACMLLGICGCLATLAWTIVVCCACCCKACLTPPLPILSGITFLFLLIGVGIMGGKSADKFSAISGVSGITDSIGYSMVAGIIAVLAMFADIIVGVILVKVSKVAPI